jgi:hypothetical protein
MLETMQTKYYDSIIASVISSSCTVLALFKKAGNLRRRKVENRAGADPEDQGLDHSWPLG